MAADDAAPPAAAYYTVASLLSPSYFKQPPPPRGTRVRVIGADGIPTFWEMDAGLAVQLEKCLRKRRDVTYSSMPYEAGGPLP